jgi:hypothetical protein
MHSPFKDRSPAFLIEAGPGLAKNASFQVNYFFSFLSVFFPAVRSDEFNKAASPQIGFMDPHFILGNLDEVLGMLIAYWYHQPSTFD